MMDDDMVMVMVMVMIVIVVMKVVDGCLIYCYQINIYSRHKTKSLTEQSRRHRRKRSSAVPMSWGALQQRRGSVAS